MFGLAIWDTRSQTLLLARDRIGIKPLHYARSDGRLYFGSEIKSLLCAPDLPRDVDFDALDHYLSFLYTPRDGSIFKNVRKLPPGHLLTWKDGVARGRPVLADACDETFAGTEARRSACAPRRARGRRAIAPRQRRAARRVSVRRRSTRASSSG